MVSSASARKAQLRREQHAAKRQDDGGPLAWRGWFDGSAHPNPGRLGIGALLLGPHGERIEISEPAGDGDSSDAEYAALTALLRAAVKVQPVQLLLCGDSQVVIDDVLGATRTAARGLASQRAVARALMKQLPQVSLRWIPRHRNGEADRLSQMAIESLRAETETSALATGDGSLPV